MKKVTISIIGFLFFCVVVYGSWILKREWNSYWFYDSATIEVVCDMVKPEYIKEGKCD